MSDHRPFKWRKFFLHWPVGDHEQWDFFVEPLFSVWKVFSVYSLLSQHRVCLQLRLRSLAHCHHSPFSTDSTGPLRVLRLHVLTNTDTVWQTDLCNMDGVYECAWEITSLKRNFVLDHNNINVFADSFVTTLWFTSEQSFSLQLFTCEGIFNTQQLPVSSKAWEKQSIWCHCPPMRGTDGMWCKTICYNSFLANGEIMQSFIW